MDQTEESISELKERLFENTQLEDKKGNKEWWWTEKAYGFLGDSIKRTNIWITEVQETCSKK